MDIRIGEHAIMSDSCNFILAKITQTSKGEESKRYIGFYASLENLFKGLLKFKIRESEATDLKQLIADIKKIKEEIKEYWEGIE